MYGLNEVLDINKVSEDEENFKADFSMSEYGRLIKEKDINLIIVFDSGFSKMGFVNYFKYNLGIPTIGITRYWLQLETSKRFGKEFMLKNEIPTSEYSIVNDIRDLKEKIVDFGLPLVLKDDRPCYGFGSHICKTEKECFKIAKKLLKENKFFIVERFIYGEEVTLQMLWDGNKIVPLAPVRDYKRLKRNNEGINTGSMGCYLPVNLSDKKQKMMQEYVEKLENVFVKIKPNFTGIFASDLIFTEEEVFNLEFNMRPCTPEFEAFIYHMNNDLVKILYDTATGNAKEINFDYKSGTTACVNVFHKDYVKHSLKEKKKKIKISRALVSEYENIMIDADFDRFGKDEVTVSTHIRAFAVLNNDEVDPLPAIYKHLERITDKNLIYRDDIGK